MASPTLLERPLYSFSEAARLLEIPTTTLKRWIDGQGDHDPVIRLTRTGADAVTWGEFVEAGYLREYRRRYKVPLSDLRPFIRELRDGLGVPYPLATERPLVGQGRRLVLDLQQRLDLDERLYMVVGAAERGQLALPAEEFFEKVEFEDEIAVRMHPRGRQSPIVIDPVRSFGLPTIRGIRTETIAEAVEAGESLAYIVETWELTPDEVREAVQWETHRQAA